MALTAYTTTGFVANAQDDFVSTVRAGDRLFAAVSVNHSPSWWLVDTGASLCEFDLDRARSLQLKRSNKYRLVPNSKNRGGNFFFVETPDLQVGTVQCGPCILLAHPLTHALSEAEAPAHWPGGFERTGLLGMSLLLEKRALIVWSKHRIYLDPSREMGSLTESYEAEGYTPIPFKITTSKQIQIEGTLGSNRYQFCLDTGTARTMLDQSVVDQEHLPSEFTKSVVTSPMKEFGDSKVSRVKPTRFQLGDFDLTHRKTLAASLHLSRTDLGGIWAGLIGDDILWEYDAVIDLGSNTLYLREPTSDRPGS